MLVETEFLFKVIKENTMREIEENSDLQGNFSGIHYWEDKRISFKEKGILTALLADSEQKLDVEALVSMSTDGKTSVYAGLKKLEQYGYYTRKCIRINGKIEKWEVIVSPY